MKKFINLLEFTQYLFDSVDLAKKAAIILKAILDAESPRLSAIAQKMLGKSEANYKEIQRFLAKVNPKDALMRLFQADAPFVIGDVTEIPRPGARKTQYVGTLKDGKTKGFWVLVLATPFRGRAIPFSFITYSSRTIAEQGESRNLNHFRAFREIKEILGEKPLVLDREFSYLELLGNMVAEGMNFVIRLNQGSHQPTFLDRDAQRVELSISPGEIVIHNNIFYKGVVCVNVIGIWKKGFNEPLWVMSNLEAEEGLEIYLARMKIEESFRDLKNLLHLDKVMNKKQANMEKMVAMVMLAYSIGSLIGEEIRDQIYGKVIQDGEEEPDEERIEGKPKLRKSRKWKLYSGLFILLKQKIHLSAARLRQIVKVVLESFITLVQHPVRTYV